MSARDLAPRIALAARRAGASLPRPLKRMLLRAVPVQRVAPAATVESWDAPLTGGRAGFALPSPTVAPAVTAPREDAGPVGGGLRCLLVTDTLDASGVEEFVAFLARGLRAGGCSVAVLVAHPDAARPAGLLARELRADGIPVQSFGPEGGAAWIADWAPDVVDSHAAASWPLRVAAERGIPGVLTLHGPHNAMDRTSRQLAEQRAHAHTVVAVSQSVAEHYRAAAPDFAPDRVVAIGNPVDPSRLPGADRRAVRNALGLQDEFLFLSLARHAVQKNAYGLVSAFADTAGDVPGARLLICGRVDDPDYTAQVVALRDRLGLRGRVFLRDHLVGATALLNAADAFVLDSFFEGWSLASLEALGTGVPCILSDVGGAREQLVGRPPRGILVANPLGDTILSWEAVSAARFRPQANRAALAQAMRDVATGAAAFPARAQIARDAADRFSADTCIAAHLEVLRRAAAARTDGEEVA